VRSSRQLAQGPARMRCRLWVYVYFPPVWLIQLGRVDTELAVDVVPMDGMLDSSLSGTLTANQLRPGYPVDSKVTEGQALFLRIVWKEPQPFALKIDRLSGDISAHCMFSQY